MDEKNLVWITYIGNRVYNPNRFKREADKLGVNRAIPPNLLKKLGVGTRVYTLFKRKNWAVVTGYFIITGYTWQGDGRIREWVKEHMDELGIRKVSDGGYSVERGCGSYVVGSTYTTEDPQQAMIKIYEKAKEEGWSIKIFVAGYYRELSKKKRVNLPFTRGFAQYYLDIEGAGEYVDEGRIMEIKDYAQIKYRPKRRR